MAHLYLNKLITTCQEIYQKKTTPISDIALTERRTIVNEKRLY